MARIPHPLPNHPNEQVRSSGTPIARRMGHPIFGGCFRKDNYRVVEGYGLSKGGEDYGYDEEAEEEASAVGDGVDDWVFVELASGGLEPEAA